MFEYRAKVLEVTDGDTVKVLIDCGFSIFHKISLRLQGVYAPETRTRDLEEKERGVQSKEFLSNLIANQDVVVHTKFDKSFDRYVGTIYLGGLNVNQHIIDEGFARPDAN